MKEVIQGVYKIANLINSKCYIGSSKNITVRFQSHKNQLSNGSHVNPFLQQEWSAFGADNFEFSLLEEISDSAMLIRCEQRWIDDISLKSQIYNRNLTATTGGCKISAVAEKAKAAYERSGKTLSAKQLAARYKLAPSTIYRAEWFKKEKK